MKSLAFALLTCASLTGFKQTPATAEPEPMEHTFILRNFHTESGIILPHPLHRSLPRYRDSAPRSTHG